MSASRVLLQLTVVIYHTYILVEGNAQITVTPFPALIFHGAVQNVPVLSVTATDTDTGQPLQSVALTNSRDSDYFKLIQQPRVPNEWILKVKKTIDKPVGYVFTFSVYGYYNQTPQDRRIQINVTEENEHAPSFEQQEYTFVALRNGLDYNLTDIGTVKAVDADTEIYNKQFHYHILDPHAERYFLVDLETGLIEMTGNIPAGVSNVTFSVTAIDGGSPQRLNTTDVTVIITDLRPPDVFCVAVEESIARVCWKDPTNGSYVMKYELLFKMDDQNATTVPVRVEGVKDETCSIVTGNQLGRNYTFSVRVFNGLEWSPESLQRKVTIEKKGLYGSCPDFSNCSVWEPCQNKGECLVNQDMSYTCNCSKGWGGVNCTDVDLCASAPCRNGGTCVFTGDRNYTCNCPDTHYGDRCDKISPCVQSPCGKGHCVQKGEGHVCNCPDGIVRISCEEVFCEIDDSFYDKTGWYTWPRTKAGDTTQVLCRHGPNSIFSTGYASRYCNVDVNGTTFWDIPNTSQCLELQTEDVSQNLRNLATLTKDASGLRSEEIANITSTLEEYFFFSFENIEIAKEMTMVVGNLLDANETVMIESNFKNHSSERLLWLLEEYSKRVNTTGEIVIETENINLQVVNHTVPDTSYSYTPQLEQNNIKRKGGINLKLPAEALTSSDAEEFPRIRLMTFRSSSFFIPEEAPPQEVVMKQWVVSAVVQDRKLENLTTPVEITVKNIEDGVNHSCAYWDIKNRTWSDEGVVTLERGQNYTKCLSYHLTSFAILLDPSPDHALSAEHEQILTYISYIGCGISMLGLILTLITYSIFRPRSASMSRCLNREKSGKILMNLCASMLLLNAFFFLGSETSLSLSGDGMCKAAAILLHYFLLTTLTWMLVEAINMYQALITVFTKYSGFFMLKRCIFAWGAPALIVIATVAISVDNYKTTTELCFLSQGNPLAFYIALLGPACLILLINFAVFIMVSRVILKPKFHGQVGRNASDSVTPAQIRGAFTVMTLLGVTWVFGPFAINEAKVVVNYIFTVLNSLQGFLIFVFRCCFNPEVRMAWVMLIKTGKFKRRKGPATAYTSDSTSSKSESKLNGSVNDTMKSNVYNSLGKQRNVLNNDKNLVSKNTNMQAKTSKDLHGYFDDTQRHRGREKRSGSSENTRLYGRNYDNYDRNGFHSNGNHQRRSSDQNAITTIYTGQYNGGVKRHSGLISHQDEFTRL
ncbi:adhesion G-protein coupled receptor G6-like isoform X3 [Mercenaria mercenaria]|uniref:adhesion G-protein coupled receptor G6-like isoform X3 n=1 Tax=Mercenaria mercenaria TaxID=6596 RepID=UPI00234ED9AE|nr:adhesion G-protein coupled receptor G6-like isoform X3 [Mercenaria mercenaria]